ncbi:PhoH domain protein [Stenotrophomonas phage BUCTxx100]|nr:PhoH domain protein [Stenotrophomonas phage BUCTxx100]
MNNRNVKRANRVAKREAKAEARRKGNANLSLVSSSDIQAETQPLAKRDTTPFKPRNENQTLYWDALNNRNLLVATGSAGSGKSFAASVYACDQLLAKEVEKIIVTRPVLQSDEDLGFLPGDIAEKFAPYFKPIHEILLKRLGGGFLEYCLKPGVEKVEIAPFAYMRGNTFSDAVIILDEAQNVTVNQMKLFLTRIGENATVVINGDPLQCDLPKGVKSGLVDLLERIERTQLDVPVIRFTDDDCVRSDVCRMALKLYS